MIKIIDVFLDPVALDREDKYVKIPWSCAGCGHENVNEISQRKVENWSIDNAIQNYAWDCVNCKRTNFLEIQFSHSSEETGDNPQ